MVGSRAKAQVCLLTGGQGFLHSTQPPRNTTGSIRTWSDGVFKVNLMTLVMPPMGW